MKFATWFTCVYLASYLVSLESSLTLFNSLLFPYQNCPKKLILTHDLSTKLRVITIRHWKMTKKLKKVSGDAQCDIRIFINLVSLFLSRLIIITLWLPICFDPILKGLLQRDLVALLHNHAMHNGVKLLWNRIWLFKKFHFYLVNKY